MTRMGLRFKGDDGNSKSHSSGLKGFTSDRCQKLQYVAFFFVCLPPMPELVT